MKLHPFRRVVAAGLLAGAALAGCGGGSGGEARYPERPAGCAVKSFPGPATGAVDELGVVSVDCASNGPACTRQLLDAVCARGGDVAWGTGDNDLTATHVSAHAAHTKRVAQGPRERGCDVQVFQDIAPFHTENIGPVIAICNQDDTREVCLRELQDQVCLLGGDVVWQVEGPRVDGNKQRMQGRAAHTK
jgi:hypothetical protein